MIAKNQVLVWTFCLLHFPSRIVGICPTPSWGYFEANGPETDCWSDCPQNGQGDNQSPIDVPPYHELIKIEEALPFQWINYHEQAEDWTITNTGHSASIIVTTEDCKGFPRVIFSHFDIEMQKCISYVYHHY